MEITQQERYTNYLNDLLEVGLFPVASVEGLPMAFAYHFNEVIIQSALVFRENESLRVISKQKVFELVPKFFEVYYVCEVGLQQNIEQDVLSTLSPVLILESGIKQDALSYAVLSPLFQILALCLLGDAYNSLISIIEKGKFENCLEDCQLLIASNNSLLGSLSANAKAKELLYRSRNDFIDEITNDDISAKIQLEIRNHKSSVGGSRSMYDDLYKWAINEAEKRWKAEVKSAKDVTRITNMSNNVIEAYITLHPGDHNVKSASGYTNNHLTENVKGKIRQIATKIAPKALRSGRPKK
jgi:hypothetical protein